MGGGNLLQLQMAHGKKEYLHSSVQHCSWTKEYTSIVCFPGSV